MDREPNNSNAKSLIQEFENGLDSETFISNIGIERNINAFFRVKEKQIKEGVAASLNLDIKSLDSKKTFVGLRKLRDNW